MRVVHPLEREFCGGKMQELASIPIYEFRAFAINGVEASDHRDFRSADWLML